MAKRFQGSNWKKDVFGGIVIGFVSIPIAMGYAQIAGLPPVYGLYGSLLPILIFGLLTSSKQFIVGVDAMPAAMVGGILAQLGIASQSLEARILVPVTTLLVAVWMFILYYFKAGRIVKYVSIPVMGGFITGVGTTIIMMQVPKLFGGEPGTGEVVVLLENILAQRGSFHLPSFLLGFGTVVIILLCKKWIPKVPMTVVMMVAGALAQAVFHLDNYGVKVMSEVPAGLPRLVLPGYCDGSTLLDLQGILEYLPNLLLETLGIAGVIMAQTLLASGNYARKYQDPLNHNRELLAYGAMNVGGAFVGSCPINGSVSRSGIADSMGVRSQVASFAASATMLLVILFGTPVIKYLPVPVLTGIVMTALIGILEIKMAKKLWKVGKNEWIVFMLAFLGVLLFGTMGGIIIGVLLSFGEVAMRAVIPPTAYVGRIPGHGNFYSLKRNSDARPIKNTLIYRFSGNLFFANVDLFCDQIEAGIQKDTQQVVVDARGIGSVDVTATERLLQLYQELKERGIYFYLTEHDGSLNDQLQKMGGERLIQEGVVRRTITLALRDAGLEKPYELEERTEMNAKAGTTKEIPSLGNGETDTRGIEAKERLAEFEWVFGADAEKKMEELAHSMAEQLAAAGSKEEEVEAMLLDKEGVRTSWGLLGRFDEHEFWDFMEVNLEELVREGKMEPGLAARVERHIEKRREFGQKKLEELNPQAAKLLASHGKVIRNYVKRTHPKEYEKYLELRGKQPKINDK
ncbi:MAG: STAS domain-containing protein [Lachnospiraceae bacterium]|nr:STAS domain-containing protein [Lachnospiraceae bacterium]